MNLITKENPKDRNSGYVAKIFEQSYNVFKILEGLNKKTPLENVIMDIERLGIKKNTVYHLNRAPDWTILEPVAAALSKVKLLDIKNLAWLKEAQQEHPNQAQEPSDSHFDDSMDIPFWM